MDVRHAIFGEISIRTGQHLASIDLGVLIRRLILFDSVVVKSFRLRELPLLVKTFGKTGIQDLLNSEALKLSCEFTSVITDVHRNGVRSVPPEHFTFGIVNAANREDTLRKELRGLQTIPGLKNRERRDIEEAAWNSLVRPPSSFGTDLLQQIDFDFRTNSPSLRAGILAQLEKKLGRPNPREMLLDINVEEVQDRVFHVKNSIAQSFGLSPDETHALLQLSVAAVANLNQRLAEMIAYSALAGFRESEAPILFGKFAGILAPQNPTIVEEQFQRVIEIADVPDFRPGQRIDTETLLKIRESEECRAFKEWLSTTENMSDADLRNVVTGIRNKLGSLATSNKGKAVRFAATTPVGLIPGAGLVLGPVSTAIDSFLVDRVLPRSGVVAFLQDMYPSLFVSG